MNDTKHQGPTDHSEAGRNDVQVSAAAGYLFLKPYFAILLVFLLIVSGILSYVSMVKEAAPDLAIPMAIVVTSWVGADPVTIEKQITNKIEAKLKAMKGLKNIYSASSNSVSAMAVEFKADMNLDEAMQLLREKVADAQADLPPDADRPTIKQISVDDTPVLSIALYGQVDYGLLSRVADELGRRLEKVSGVRDVQLGGQRKEIIQVLLHLNRLVALGISPATIGGKIKAADLDMPLDRYENPDLGASIRLLGSYRNIEEIQNLPVARVGQDRIVRLGEIARVTRGLEKEKSRVSFSAEGGPYKTSLDLSVLKNPGEDTLRLIADVKKVLEDFKDSEYWPFGLEYEITTDQSISIRDNLSKVFNNGLQAMAAVFIILLIMLTWREALVAGLSIPITFLGSLGVLYALGNTLNQVVIVGMVMALGLLVDVFILMMEGMHNGIFVDRLGFRQSAINTIKTYAMPAFAGQMTTILAMVPLFAIGGVQGKFIAIMPTTVVICLVISFIIALLIDVPLSRYVMPKNVAGIQKTRLDLFFERVSRWWTAFSLDKTVRSKGTAWAWTLGALALFVLAVMSLSQVPTEMYPPSYGEKLGVLVELAPGTTLDQSQVVADDLGEVLRKKAYLANVTKFVGQKSPLSGGGLGDKLASDIDTHLLGFSCIFKPDTDVTAELLDDVQAGLAAALERHPGAKLVLTPQRGGTSNEDPIQIQLVGDDIDRLRDISAQVRAALEKIPGASEVRDNLGSPRADVQLIPVREAMDFYMLNQDELAYQLLLQMSDQKVGDLLVEGTEDDLPIRLGTAWPSRKGELGGPTRPEEIVSLRVFPYKGDPLPVLAVVRPVMDQAPTSITHKDGLRSVTVSSKVTEGTAGEVLARFAPVLQDMAAGWPLGYEHSFAGEAESQAETFGDVGTAFILAIFLVFALLVLQFSSFAQPLIIVLTIPFAMIGTFGGFFLLNIPISFPAMLGIIALVGIVVNNAIVMVDTMNTYRAAGMGVQEAAAKGAADRIRPILSTTLTTVVGLIPLALGDPMWMPLCSAIIFGLLVSTFSGQLVVPCLYFLLTADKPADSSG
ncbi:MAG: efflux RND transporter permease subunit [Proteobacteria bacterium]|nr:efflux RND transporter permease subunit [Pseudomonadota bacterium]